MKIVGKSISSKTIAGIIIPTILIIIPAIFYFISAHSSFVSGNLDKATISNQAPESCTILTASQGDKVLFGNNEDWINPNTYYWTVPPTNDNFGVVYFGFDNFWPQGGINEKGLAYDVNALPKSPLNPHPELPKVDYPFYENLKKYSTVEEVIKAVQSYSWESAWRAQLHVADRTGDAVVISAGPDGEIAFTRKQKENGFLVSTNFNLANRANGRYPCIRYDIATEMLGKVNNEEKLTVEYIQSLLNAVHQEGPSVNTVYSNIFDLKKGIIYLYHSHQFDEVVQLNVSNELAKAPSRIRIEDLFSQETIDKAKKQNFEYQKKIIVWKSIVWIWIFISAVSAFLLIWDFTHKTEAPWRIQIVWFMVTILYGPIGLMAYIVTYRQPQRLINIETKIANWRQALRETLFSVVGPAIGLSLAFASFYLILPFNESTIWSVAARLYGLPLLVGLFFYRTPLIEYYFESRYWRAVRRRLISEVILQNFVLSGMLPVVAVLIVYCEKNMGMRGPTNVLFWGAIYIGGIAGALTVFPCNLFIAHYRASLPESSVLAYQNNHQIKEASDSINLRNSWILFLCSFIILGCSLFMLFSSL
jgi:hypothetical protein